MESARPSGASESGYLISQVRPIPLPTLWVFGGVRLEHNLNSKGWDSHVHRGISRNVRGKQC